MERRSAIKQLMFIAGGAVLLPGCVRNMKQVSLALNNLKISGDDEELLAEVAETIIPKTDTPGAKDLSAHLFILKMVDDCYSKENQQKFMQGLDAFKKTTDKKFGKTFAGCNAQEREQLLNEMESRKEKDELSFFYGSVKRLTIQAYTTSEFYLTKIREYKLIPGPYKGCVPVQQS